MNDDRREVTDHAEALKLVPVSDELLVVAATHLGFKAVAIRLVCFERFSVELADRRAVALKMLALEDIPGAVPTEIGKSGKPTPFSVVNFFAGALAAPPTDWEMPEVWNRRAALFATAILPSLFNAAPEKVAAKLVGGIGGDSQWPESCVEECIAKHPGKALHFIKPLMAAHGVPDRNGKSDMRRLARLATKRALEVVVERELLEQVFGLVRTVAKHPNPTQDLALQLSKQLETRAVDHPEKRRRRTVERHTSHTACRRMTY